MGTRSNTIVKIGDDVVLNMYRQFDGYLDGHGKELKEAFGNTKIINGISDQTAPNFANGLSCLAAQIVGHFKDGIGSIYLHSGEEMDNDYGYLIYIKEDTIGVNSELPIYIKIYEYGDEIYDGLLSEMPTEN